MKNTLYLILAVFALVLLSVSTMAVTLTVVSGTITDQSNAVVDGATVQVVCHHGSTDNTLTVTSGSDGKYYAFFPALQCNAGDTATVTATKGDASNSETGSISYLSSCRINVGIINVQIPEFGVIAGGVALIGAIAGFAIMRKRN
jgi:hypothetical protein